MIQNSLRESISAFDERERNIVLSHLDNIEKNAPRSKHTISYVLAKAFREMGKPLLMITKRDVIAFLNSIDKNKADSTKVQYFCHLEKFFAFAVDSFDMDNIDFKNPMPSTAFFKFTQNPMKKRTAKFLTMEQLKSILKLSYKKSKKEYIFFLLVIHTGMRPSECCGIRIEDIHIPERYLETGKENWCAKSTRHMNQPLEFCFSREVAAQIKDYLLYINRKSGWLFTSTKSLDEPMSFRTAFEMSRKYSEWLGFKFTMNYFRHTVISNRKQTFDGESGKPKIDDWESEILMNHIPKSTENKKYLEKPIEFKRKLFDRYYVYKGLI